MTTFTIEYDISELKKLVKEGFENAPEQTLPNTAMAFQRAAEYIRNTWTGYLAGETSLNGIDFLDGVTSKMVQSVMMRKNGDFDHSVYSENLQLEQKVKGSKEVEYDMKKTHPYGKNSRVAKTGKNKGVPYLIIPFRWGTPNGKDTKRRWNNFIPQKYYETSVSGLEISSKNALKNYFEKNFKGENVERQGYNWAKFGRLTDAQSWNDRSRGMVRMLDDSNPRRITSTYFTFRIISANSPIGSWIYHKDAKPGVDLMGALESTVKPKVDSMIAAGIQADEDFYKNN